MQDDYHDFAQTPSAWTSNLNHTRSHLMLSAIHVNCHHEHVSQLEVSDSKLTKSQGNWHYSALECSYVRHHISNWTFSGHSGNINSHTPMLGFYNIIYSTICVRDIKHIMWKSVGEFLLLKPTNFSATRLQEIIDHTKFSIHFSFFKTCLGMQAILCACGMWLSFGAIYLPLMKNVCSTYRNENNSFVD